MNDTFFNINYDFNNRIFEMMQNNKNYIIESNYILEQNKYITLAKEYLTRVNNNFINNIKKYTKNKSLNPIGLKLSIIKVNEEYFNNIDNKYSLIENCYTTNYNNLDKNQLLQSLYSEESRYKYYDFPKFNTINNYDYIEKNITREDVNNCINDIYNNKYINDISQLLEESENLLEEYNKFKCISNNNEDNKLALSTIFQDFIYANKMQEKLNYILANVQNSYNIINSCVIHNPRNLKESSIIVNNEYIDIKDNINKILSFKEEDYEIEYADKFNYCINFNINFLKKNANKALNSSLSNRVFVKKSISEDYIRFLNNICGDNGICNYFTESNLSEYSPVGLDNINHDIDILCNLLSEQEIYIKDKELKNTYIKESIGNFYKNHSDKYKISKEELERIKKEDVISSISKLESSDDFKNHINNAMKIVNSICSLSDERKLLIEKLDKCEDKKSRLLYMTLIKVYKLNIISLKKYLLVFLNVFVNDNLHSRDIISFSANYNNKFDNDEEYKKILTELVNDIYSKVKNKE